MPSSHRVYFLRGMIGFSLLFLPMLAWCYPWQEYEHELSVNLVKSFSPIVGGVPTYGGRYKHHNLEFSVQKIDDHWTTHAAYRSPFGEGKMFKPHAAGGVGWFDGPSLMGGVGVNIHSYEFAIRIDQYMYINPLLSKVVPLTTLGVSWAFHELPF